MKSLLKVACFFGLTISAFTCFGQAVPKCPDREHGTTTVSASSITLDNTACSGLHGTFDYEVTGSPATLSVTLQGCMRAPSTAPCSLLDTYSLTASVNRKPTIDSAYDYFLVTPTWTGGTSVTFTVNSTITIAAGGTGGGSGGSIAAGTTGQPAVYTSGSAIGSSSISLDASAFSGADWIAKMNAAAATLSGVGGVVYIPASLAGASSTTPVLVSGITYIFGSGGSFQYSTGFSFTGLFNIRLTGQVNIETAQVPVTELRYTGASGSGFTMGGASATYGIEIDHLALTYSSVAYTDKFIVTGSTPSNSAYIRIHDNIINGRPTTNGTAAALIAIDFSFDVNIERNNFLKGAVAILGSPTGLTHANQVRIRDNFFSFPLTTNGIQCGGTSWVIEGNEFEPIDGTTTHADFNTTSAGCLDLKYSGNWSSDGTSGIGIAATGGPIQGAEMSGNYWSWATSGTALSLGGGTGISDGINVFGNAIDTVTGIDAGASNPPTRTQIGLQRWGSHITNKLASNAFGAVSSLGPVMTICNQATYLTNTGNTSTNVIGSCQIPKGTMFPTSRLKLHLIGQPCTGAGVPFAGCAGANTGTCGVKVAWNASATNAGTALVNNTIPIGVKWQVDGQVANQSASAQNLDWLLDTSTMSGVNVATAALDTSLASANDTFLVFMLTNSVSGDVCGERLSVELRP